MGSKSSASLLEEVPIKTVWPRDFINRQTSVLSISLNTSAFVWMIPFGLSSAISTRVSNELGAGWPQAARLAVRIVLLLAVSEGLMVGLILVCVRYIWGHAYSDVEEVVSYVARMMLVIAVTIFFDGIMTVLSVRRRHACLPGGHPRITSAPRPRLLRP
ncbi:protein DETOXIFICATION 16-like [Miscanthus floridulus]|uniref:protein DETOXIFICATION 16-like n=1 Tax=Miscanthus floridulus TaxID=154761 RepID=UPI003458B448